MDPREAMDITIKAFNLKAADIAQNSGITVQMLSRYRKKRQDMTSLKVFQVIRALPPEAQNFFWRLSTDTSERPVPLILDGFDESPGVERLGKSKEMFTMKNNEMKVMITSRPSSLEEDLSQYSDNNKASSFMLNSVIEELVLKYLNEHMSSILHEEVEHYLNEKWKHSIPECADVAER